MDGLPEGSKRVGFVLDGEVVDFIGTPPRLGAILLANPTIVDLTDKPEVSVGCRHSDGEFDCSPQESLGSPEAEEKRRAVKPWDMLNKENYTDDETAQNRFETCLNCEFLIKLTKTCKKCGCFMQAKTKLADASCPVGKWGAVARSSA
jgi:hypothetical protein